MSSQPDLPDLARIRMLYEDNFILQAYTLATERGPLRDWTDPDALVLAHRVLNLVGAPRLGALLLHRAWRRHRQHEDAQNYYVLQLLERRGPWAALQFLKKRSRQPTEVRARADWLLLHAQAYGALRDFEVSRRWLDQAAALEADRPWLHAVRAGLLGTEDRYEDALEAALTAVALRPGYRPGVQQAAHFLVLLGREHEAIALLRDAVRGSECSPFVGHLIQLLVDQREWTEVLALLERFVTLNPVMEGPVFSWYCAVRSDVAYGLGDLDSAAHFAVGAGSGFFSRIAERLEKGGAARRVLLPVPFVRQHRMTCAPATLTAVSRLWQQPAEHLQVTEEICYDGTPAHSEREWAVHNGWAAREFTVTWEGATALLDRGVAFTLATTATGSAHLQAAIGYDTLRRTLLVRDPFQAALLEFDLEGLLLDQASSGPRGMALVPIGEAHRLEGLPLAEAELRDHLHELQTALVRHDRAAAGLHCEALLAAAPDAPPAIQGRRALAAYDADPAAGLSAVEAALRLFPEDLNFFLAQLGHLRRLGRSRECLALLEERVRAAPTHPLLWVEYADALREDDRQREVMEDWLRRAMRVFHEGSHAYHSLAASRWSQSATAEALELYRCAACLGDKNESAAAAYFAAARAATTAADGADPQTSPQEEVLRYLESRVERLGALSSAPVITWCDALAALDRTEAVFAALTRARARRPTDGELLLYTAGAHARVGQLTEAEAALETARPLVRLNAWRRQAASLAEYRGLPAEALAQWQAVLETEPLALDAHRAVARGLAETEGQDTAVAHLQAAVARFPHHHDLRRLLYDWLPQGDPAERLALLDQILLLSPTDAWARRERASVLPRLNRLEEGFAELERARELDPEVSSYFNVLGRLEELAGRPAAARAAYRSSLQREIDSHWTIHALLAVDESRPRQLEDLAFLRAELARQAVFGEALSSYVDVARGILAPEELLQQIREALVERPRLWEATCALSGQLTEMGRASEALQTAKYLCNRFPLVTGSWLELARVHEVLRASEPDTAFGRFHDGAERKALQRALQISGRASRAATQLAAALRRDNDLPGARAVLERAVAGAPLDAGTHSALARVLWEQKECGPAVERLEHALRLDPQRDGAWRTLTQWRQEQKNIPALLDFARDLTRRRPGSAGCWHALSRLLDEPGEAEECLAATERAIALDPLLDHAHDLRAEAFARLKRYDEALAATRPAVHGAQPPLILRGRAAWVLAARGSVREAITAMQEILRDAPDYEWGLARLVDWASESEDWKTLLVWARKWSDLDPRDVRRLGFLAQAQRALGQKEEAKEVLKRALDIDCGYRYAGRNLLEIQLEQEDAGGALDTFRLMRAAGVDPEVLLLELRVATHREGRPVREVYADLLAHPQADKEQLRRGTELIVTHWSLSVAEELTRALRAEKPAPMVAWLWGQHAATRLGMRRAWRSMRELQGELAARAIGGYVERLGQLKRRITLCLFVLFFRPVLRASSELWGSTGNAFTHAGLHRLACRWLRAWRFREGLKPWMLSNLVVSSYEVGDEQEALAAARASLTLDSGEKATRIKLWAAYLGSLLGRQVPTATELSALDPEPFGTFFITMKGLTETLLIVRNEPASDPGRFRSAFAKLNDVVNRIGLGAPKSVGLVRRTRIALGTLRGGFRGWWEAMAARLP